jgi:hypothetical protein
MMIVNFDSQGFLVTVKGNMDGIPILGGMVTNELNKHKAEMEEVLKTAAGIGP